MTPSERKQNIRFQLWVNGEVKATAGLDSFGVLSQTLSWVRRDPNKARKDETDIARWVCDKIHLRLGGLDSTSDEHLEWHGSELQVGDEIRVQVLAPGEFDVPAERCGSTCGLKHRPRSPRVSYRRRQIRGPSWRKRWICSSNH
jgi:hypothetical protein